MKAQIKHKFLTLCSTSYLNWGGGGALAFPQPPKTDELIAKSGEKHKFWDFEAQIEHKFFDPFMTEK